MFIQNSRGNIRIQIDTTEIGGDKILEDAKVSVKIRRGNYELEREAIILSTDLNIAMCYLEAEDLKYPGNYDYQVLVTTKDGYVVKSALSSFYVSPSIR